MQKYIVKQVTLKEKFLTTGSKNLSELEEIINYYADAGYRLHTCTTSESTSKGLMGADRIQATLVFELIDSTNPTAAIKVENEDKPSTPRIHRVKSTRR